MRAAGPATGAALAIQQIFFESSEVLLSRLFFFDDGHPADPLIACERRDALPALCDYRICIEDRLDVGGRIVEEVSDGLVCHSLF